MAEKDFTPKKSGMPDFVRNAAKTLGQSGQKSDASNSGSTKKVPLVRENPKKKPFELPWAAGESSIVPDAVLRSALFSVLKKGDRRFFDDEEVACVDKTCIFHTGKQLDQGDLDIWETVLNLASKAPVGERIFTSYYEILKLAGLTPNGKNYEILEQRLKRLALCCVRIESAKYRYMGSLMVAGTEKETDQLFISLNPDISVLFEPTRFSQVDWKVRQAVKGQLAQWLHAFYSTHAKPLPMKIETLHRLCGSETQKLYHFKAELIKALESISEVSTELGQSFKYEIVGDIVHVDRTGSKTQQKHLAIKAKKAISKAVKSTTKRV